MISVVYKGTSTFSYCFVRAITLFSAFLSLEMANVQDISSKVSSSTERSPRELGLNEEKICLEYPGRVVIEAKLKAGPTSALQDAIKTEENDGQIKAIWVCVRE